jgi:hypothetical protein
MHNEYFYTLPFHFDYLHEFYKDFDDVKSNNPEILLTNSRLWYNVKYIDLRDPSKYDFHFVKQLKIKMPQLTFIEFRPIKFYEMSRTEDLYVNTGEGEKSDIRLDNITTIKYTRIYFKDPNELLINVLPKLNHMISSAVNLPSADDQLAEERIHRLDIDAYSPL